MSREATSIEAYLGAAPPDAGIDWQHVPVGMLLILASTILWPVIFVVGATALAIERISSW